MTMKPQQHYTHNETGAITRFDSWRKYPEYGYFQLSSKTMNTFSPRDMRAATKTEIALYDRARKTGMDAIAPSKKPAGSTNKSGDPAKTTHHKPKTGETITQQTTTEKPKKVVKNPAKTATMTAHQKAQTNTPDPKKPATTKTKKSKPETEGQKRSGQPAIMQ